MIRMSAEERNSILTGLKVELKSLLGKYQSDKYPEEEHQRHRNQPEQIHRVPVGTYQDDACGEKRGDGPERTNAGEQ